MRLCFGLSSWLLSRCFLSELQAAPWRLTLPRHPVLAEAEVVVWIGLVGLELLVGDFAAIEWVSQKPADVALVAPSI